MLDIPISDDQLILSVTNGNAEALEELYDRYVRQCFGLALRILGDSALAEEVVQEVFLKLWSRPDSYSAQRGKFVSWLLSLVHHRCIDELRKRSHTEVPLETSESTSVLDTVADPDLGPGEQVWVAEQQRVVREALGQLPANQRQVIELAYFGGLSQSQIAERLGQPLGTVKTRVRMGLQSLRGLIETGGLLAE
ncbi:MAG: sigma-70 family RNA polymerase sigma factor [Chloroflexota bacterium]|nr:sigma-70 family RNA polymerase sigma factor [Chloroflexota bacterium]